MAKFLANENVPGEVVEAARLAGHDLAWICELSPGDDDDAVLARSLAESRVLVTFDKDFGEMAFLQGKIATCGVILSGLPRCQFIAFCSRVRQNAGGGRPAFWRTRLQILRFSLISHLGSPGVILLRPRLQEPDYVAKFTVAVLAQQINWEGHFCMAQEGKLRVVALP